MESFVPKDSPLDDYLQGSCVLRQRGIREDFILTCLGFLGVGGESEENWQTAETNSDSEHDIPASDFAPRGASRFQSRVRNKLPKPLNIRSSPHGAIIEKLYTVCSVGPPRNNSRIHSDFVCLRSVGPKRAHCKRR